MKQKYHELRFRLGADLVMKMKEKGIAGQDLARAVMGDMGLSHNGASCVISQFRRGYFFIEIPEQAHKEAARLDRLAILYHHLGVKEDDPMVLEISSITPHFKYPPTIQDPEKYSGLNLTQKLDMLTESDINLVERFATGILKGYDSKKP